MENLITMLKEIDTKKNSPEDLRQVLNLIAKEIENKTEKLKNIIDYLESHNKNYTKEQYYKILDLQDIINGEE